MFPLRSTWIMIVITILFSPSESLKCSVVTEINVALMPTVCYAAVGRVQENIEYYNSLVPEHHRLEPIGEDYCYGSVEVTYEENHIRFPFTKDNFYFMQRFVVPNKLNFSRPVTINYDFKKAIEVGENFIHLLDEKLDQIQSPLYARTGLSLTKIVLISYEGQRSKHYSDHSGVVYKKDGKKIYRDSNEHALIIVNPECSEGFSGSQCCAEIDCGDGIEAGSEECDNLNDVGDTSSCPHCRHPKCGDNYLFSNSLSSTEECEPGLGTSPGTNCSNVCILQVPVTIASPNGVAVQITHHPHNMDGIYSIELFKSNEDGDHGVPFKQGVELYNCESDCETPESWRGHILPDSWYIVRSDFIRNGISNKADPSGYSWSNPIRTPCGCSYDNPTGAPKNVRVFQRGNIIQISYIQDSGCATAMQARRLLHLSDGQYDNRPVLVGTKQTFSGNPLEQCGVESEGDFYEEIGSSVGTKLVLGSIHKFCLTVTGKGIENRGTIIDHCAPDVTVKWTGKVEIRITPKGGRPDADFIQDANVTLYIVTDKGRASGALEGICGPSQCGPVEECIDDICQPSPNEDLVYRYSYKSSQKNERLDLVVPGVTNEVQEIFITAEKITELGNDTFRHRFYCNDNEDKECDYAIIAAVKHLDIQYQVTSIIDKSVFTISGRVMYEDGPDQTVGRGECGSIGAEVCLLDESKNRAEIGECVKVSTDGFYSVSVATGAKITLQPRLINEETDQKHSFKYRDYVSGSITLRDEFFIREVHQHYKESIGNPIDFIDMTEQELTLFTTGGLCDWAALGRTEVEVSHGCGWKRRFNYLTAKNVQHVPALAGLTVAMLGLADDPPPKVLSSDVVNYLDRRGIRTAVLNMTWEDAIVEWRYRVPPKITTNWPIKTCDGNPKEFKVIKALKKFVLRVTASEQYGDMSCSYIPDLILEYEDTISGPELLGCKLCSTTFNHTVDLLTPEYMENANAMINIYPVVPRLEGDHTFSFSYLMEVPGYPDLIGAPDYIIVTGNKPISTSRSVELPKWTPLLYLRDPPGGLSYSEYSKTISTSKGLSVDSTVESGDGYEIETASGLDLETEACFGFGATICTESAHFVSKLLNEFEKMSVAGDGSGTGYVMDITVTETFRTSDFESNPGRNSDMVLIPSVFIKYSEATTLIFTETCEIETKSAFTWTPDRDANSFSFRSLFDIENKELPAIMDLKLAAEKAYKEAKEAGDNVKAKKKAVKAATAADAYNGWSRVVKQNDELKAAAVSCKDPQHCINIISGTSDISNNIDDINTIVFGGGGALYSYEREFSNTSTVTSSSTYYSEFDEAYGAELGVEAFGVGVLTESLYIMSTTISWESVEETSTTKGNTIAFELGDPDIGDKFVVAVLTDPVYKTPVFRTLSGETRCPIEENTTPREQISVSVDNSHLRNIPHDQSSIFPVKIFNESPTKENIGTYVLEISPGSNQDGLVVSLFGEPLPYSIPSFPDDSTVLELPLVVSRGPEAYSYSNVEVEVYSPCEDELDLSSDAETSVGATIVINVDFIAPCAEISFGGKIGEEGRFSVTKSSGPEKERLVKIELKNPVWNLKKWSDMFSSEDSDKLESIKLQYRILSEFTIEDWKPALDGEQQAIVVTEVDDSTSGIVVVEWMSPPYDGTYELRAFTQCGEGKMAFTKIVHAFVDFVLPEVFDSAEPADSVYFPGDEISVEFTEDIDCPRPYKYTTTAMVIEDSADVLEMNSRCYENKIELAIPPNYDYRSLMDRTLKITVQNFADLAGNVQQAPVSWKFKVAKFDLHKATAHFSKLTLDQNYGHIIGRSDVGSLARHVNEFTERLQIEIAGVVQTTVDRVSIDKGSLSHGFDSKTTQVDFFLLPAKQGLFLQIFLLSASSTVCHLIPIEIVVQLA